MTHEQAGQVAQASAAAVSAAAGSQMIGSVPTPELVVWALAGGLVAVWLDQQTAVAITWRWAVSAAAKAAAGALMGIAGSAVLLAVAPALPGGQWVAKVPPWAVAFGIALVAHRVLPALIERARGWLGVAKPAPPAEQGAGDANRG